MELILDWIAKCDFSRAFTTTPYVFGSYLNQAIHCEAWCHGLRQLLPTGRGRAFQNGRSDLRTRRAGRRADRDGT